MWVAEVWVNCSVCGWFQDHAALGSLQPNPYSASPEGLSKSQQWGNAWDPNTNGCKGPEGEGIVVQFWLFTSDQHFTVFSAL